jgi:cell division protein ZapA
VSGDLVPVTVSILDKEYKVACPREEQSALIAAATFLDGRMREIRESGKVIGGERIAVMAALNLAHEFLDQRQGRLAFCSDVSERVQALNTRIDIAMRAIEEGSASRD